MMPNVKKLRQISVKTLEKNVGAKKAENYEKMIYNMCVRISKESGEQIHEVYVRNAYDKLGQILSCDDKNKIFEDIQNTITDWDSSFYEKQKFNYERLMDRSVQKLTALKGVYVCKWKGCNSDEFYVWSVQLKSGDEGSTNFRQCALCGKRKKE